MHQKFTKIETEKYSEPSQAPNMQHFAEIVSDFNPIKPGGEGVIFARGKFKFKFFLNALLYEPETL